MLFRSLDLVEYLRTPIVHTYADKDGTEYKDDFRVEDIILNKPRNEDGTKMFSMVDKVTLMNEVDPNVIIRVVGEINSATEDESDLEKVEKN